MRTSPLIPGESLPELELTRSDGAVAELCDLLDKDRTLVYFMRTPTCPVCHSHLRQMTRTTFGGGALARRIVVVVPGDSNDAATVAARHPELSDRIVASATAHESIGLFVRAGLQQSGTFVVDSARTVLTARTATIPLGSFNEAEALEALGETNAPATRTA
ncbi:hypothetical protein ACEYYH_17515 [Microbacterium trichothecenolyticum]|uniref:hypothetical protein n=1 Tax=Microbacterium trichothecenolyticum TaxID=69370 RepID=UPI0035BE9A41